MVDPASLARRKYLAWQKVFEENQAINVDYHIKHGLSSVVLYNIICATKNIFPMAVILIKCQNPHIKCFGKACEKSRVLAENILSHNQARRKENIFCTSASTPH